MGFVKKNNKSKKKKLIAVTLGGVTAVSVFGFVGASQFNKQSSQVMQEYEVQIDALKEKIRNEQVETYIPVVDITYGMEIKEEYLKKENVTTSVDDAKYITGDDIGKYANTLIPKDVPVMKHMITEEIVKDSTREEEFNMIYLPRNLEEGEYVDVRIRFPNGEDYIVLPKKKVQEMDKERNIVYHWLDAEEIMRMSSAIVDAYLVEGSMLYIVTYIDGEQSPSKVTYNPNINVIEAIENDPNIIDIASMELATQLRSQLDERIEIMPELVYEPIEYKDVFVEYEVDEEQSQRQEEESTENEVESDDYY